MSMTPTTPNFTSVAKSFWNRPEGKTGKIFIVAAGIGTAMILIYFWGLIVPFLVSAMANSIELAGLIAVMGVITSPIWSSHVRLLVSNAFQLSMRWTTQLFIETDPIGMLRNNIANLRKESVTFDGAVSSLAGSQQRLNSDIAKNQQDMMRQKALADETDRQIGIKHNELTRLSGQNAQAKQLEIEQLVLQKQGYYATAGLEISTIKSEQAVLDQTNTMYNQLCRLRNLAKFKVDSLSQQADMLSKRRDMILSSQKALAAAGHIIKGDPAELAIVDQTIDYLNNEADDTIGAMNDFNQWSEKALTDMDIQKGADAGMAKQKFDEMEKKLSAPPISMPGLPTSMPTIDMTQDNTGTYVPVSSLNDYSDLLK